MKQEELYHLVNKNPDEDEHYNSLLNEFNFKQTNFMIQIFNDSKIELYRFPQERNLIKQFLKWAEKSNSDFFAVSETVTGSYSDDLSRKTTLNLRALNCHYDSLGWVIQDIVNRKFYNITDTTVLIPVIPRGTSTEGDYLLDANIAIEITDKDIIVPDFIKMDTMHQIELNNIIQYEHAYNISLI